jgi:hypothetical protein
MVPWAHCGSFDKTIPKTELLDALTDRRKRVILPGDVRRGRGKGRLETSSNWTQLTFTATA